LRAQVIQEGPLAGVPVRQAEAAAEKSFLLHRVRLALAHHCAAGDGFSALLGAIKRGAKAAGESHTFFLFLQDLIMDHKYSRLRTCLFYSHDVYEMISACISFLTPPGPLSACFPVSHCLAQS
jgi:hypothetical protein